MSHDRGCYCGRESYEFQDCLRADCTKLRPPSLRPSFIIEKSEEPKMNGIPFAVLNRYHQIMNDYSLGPLYPRCDTENPTRFHHLKWMLEEMAMMEDTEKAMRWLGFIQGVLITLDCTTVNAERDFTRPYFKKE